MRNLIISSQRLFFSEISQNFNLKILQPPYAVGNNFMTCMMPESLKYACMWMILVQYYLTTISNLQILKREKDLFFFSRNWRNTESAKGWGVEGEICISSISQAIKNKLLSGKHLNNYEKLLQFSRNVLIKNLVFSA